MKNDEALELTQAANFIDVPDEAPAAPEQSPVLDLLDLVWNHGEQATSHSWGRVNTSMQRALSLAIGCGMKFAPDDFAQIQRRYRFHYWGGNDAGGFAEGFYALAVAEGNVSACQAFEKWKGRAPFIADGVRPGRSVQFAHRGGFREKQRLAVGSTFHWQGQEVKVTSFADDGSYVVACSYDDPDPTKSYEKAKIDRRYRISRRDLQQARREQKEPDTSSLN